MKVRYSDLWMRWSEAPWSRLQIIFWTRRQAESDFLLMGNIAATPRHPEMNGIIIRYYSATSQQANQAIRDTPCKVNQEIETFVINIILKPIMKLWETQTLMTYNLVEGRFHPPKRARL